MNKKSVLIIGGGAAGHLIAYQLRDVAQVTLVDPKTYYEVPMAVPRLLVEPDGLAARFAYRDFLGEGQHLQGKALAIADNSARVATADGAETTVTFDYAVVATGSSYLDPLLKAQAPTEQHRAAEIRAMHDRLRDARNVVVVGGGAVGVETAAELHETFPLLNITIVHGGRSILDGAPAKFAAWAEKDMRRRGVEFITDELVVAPGIGEQPADGVVQIKSGRTIAADAVIWAVGTTPNTDFIKASWPAVVNDRGLLAVDRYLRVDGHPTVFAAGDITDLPENRLAIVSGLHVKAIVGNLKKLIASTDPAQAKLKPYKPAIPGKGMGKVMIVTLGRNDGLTSLPFGQFRASFLAKKIKAADMLVGMTRKALGG